jgi:3-hydroxybutyryl-CoA dehydrogenase
MTLPEASTPGLRRIAVIGAGTMGHGIAQGFARAGFPVTLHDIAEDRLRQARANIAQNLQDEIAWGLTSAAEREAALGNLATTTSLAVAGGDADLVIEAVFEDLDLKLGVFRDLDAVCPPHTILASNTSSYPPSRLAAVTNRPERVLVAHYFYPPPLMPLVEIVAGPATAPEVVRAVWDVMQAAGKQPIVARQETVGFIVNRLQMALLREAYHLIEAGVATAEDIDRATKYSFGRRLAVVGPLELAEVQDGWDVQQEINRQIFPDLSTASEAGPVVQAKIAEGNLGAKSGQGFYVWTPEMLAAWRQNLFSALAGFLKPGPGNFV